MFSGLDDIPPACAVNYVPWTILGFIFQYIIRRRHFTFWAKYNYVLSAALDTGTAIGVLFVFFWWDTIYVHLHQLTKVSSLQYPLEGRIGALTIQKWWGNTVFMQTADWSYAPLKTLTPGETFGTTSW